MAKDRSSWRLHPSVNERRVAVVLAGGGALGAYEVGVLRVLERFGIRPAVLAGTSVGALNALSWAALGGRTKPLMRLWRTLNASGIGLRWSTLTLRIAGAFLVMLAVAEVLLTLAGQQNLSAWVYGRLRPPSSVFPEYLDLWVWVALALVGWGLGPTARFADRTLARWPRMRRPGMVMRILGWTIAGLAALWVTAGLLSWPWPMRAHALLVLVLGVAWLALVMQGRLGAMLNNSLRRVLPDTQGSGLWGSAARRAVIERQLALGDAQRLCSGEPRIVLSACGLDSGQLTYFVNWPADPDTFLHRLGHPQDRLVRLDTPSDLVEAAVASSALPLVFEPVSFRGERYVDAALFSNQPLRAAIAAGAESAVVVLLSSVHPRSKQRYSNLFSVGARLLEVGQLRDAHQELAHLPESWRQPEHPARLCVIQPHRPLEGGVLGFEPARHRRLMERGRHDALRALELAGWLEPASWPES